MIIILFITIVMITFQCVYEPVSLSLGACLHAPHLDD